MSLLRYAYLKPLLVIMVGAIFVGAAVAASLTLTLPAVTISAQAAATSSACGGALVVSGVPPAGSGTIRYNCPGTPSSLGAFTVNTIGTDTPTFTAPSQISAVGYIGHSAASCSGSTTITTGTATSLTATGDYDICANYSCPSGCTITSWTLTWSS
ncbi:MAG TPA: hypothetical protein VNA15_01870 [Candidatus Angelobacter sp.]|nr:hypothetical protein [Candidatus Angelobacter sp.]